MSETKDNSHSPIVSPIVGVILAGGRSRRMGGQDKSQLLLGAKSLMGHAISRAQPQVSQLIINGPSDRSFNKLGLPVVKDYIPGFAGPLAGALAALQWASINVADARWVATFATDAPFFPNDMVEKMVVAINEKNAETALACSAGRDHPVFALWPIAAKDKLAAAIENDGMRRVGQWFEGQNVIKIDFPTPDPFFGVDPFLNINTAKDLALAESVLDNLSDK